jgi:hypothetical protein
MKQLLVSCGGGRRPENGLRQQHVRTIVKNARAWSFKENMLYAVGARVLGISMVIAAWGSGLMFACVPPPPRRIARRSPKTRVKNKTLVGVLGRAHTRCARPRPTPRLISKKYFGGPLVFPTHVYDSAHPLVYIISLITKKLEYYWFWFFFHEDICIADL